MLVEGVGFDIFGFFDASIGVKAFLILFLVFYVFFAVILYKQTQIMNKKLPTTLSPLLRFLGIVHVGVSMAILLLVIGNF